MGQPIIFSLTFAAGSANNISLSQTPGTGTILLNGSAVTNGVATLDTQRRILVTSGASDAGITYTIKGTNQSGAPISDTFAGGATTAISNLDFKTVTAVLHSGTVASTVTVGTSSGTTLGSSPWQIVNWNAYPSNTTFIVEERSGPATTYAVEYTLDDPNILPGTGGLNAAGLGYSLPVVMFTGAVTIATAFNDPMVAFRLTTTAGTGTLVLRALQAGLGSP